MSIKELVRTNHEQSALILVGYQNDYFAKSGILRGVVEESGRIDVVLENTIALIERLAPTKMKIISTPIVLAPGYRAMASPIGILHKIRESGAFAAGTHGSLDIAELSVFGERIQYVKGKIGFNAFSDTLLDSVLKAKGVRQIYLAGMVTSLCIDSTGRAAYERGYGVSVLSDCTSARTPIEQEYFCSNVFPLYASVICSSEI